MHGESCPVQKKVEHRRQAVLALLAGDAIEAVQARFGLSRSSLFVYKRRALHAMYEALKDKRCGPRHPHNHLASAKEAAIRTVCERHPTLSSYQVKERLGSTTPTARTIQRVRKRLSLPRLKKRRTPAYKAHRFPTGQKRMIRMQIKEKLYLGPYRLAWDIQNQHHLSISPSTVKRVKQKILEEMTPQPATPVWQFYERKHPPSLWHGDFFEKVTLTNEDRTAYQLTLLDDYSRAYVYCDLLREPTLNDTIQAMITAMRKYQTIPKGVVFDNGPQFKGALLSAFCTNLGIRLIPTSVRHPQTNGKLERAFRDDRREYYDQFAEWIFEDLRAGLPAYVRYRNEVRGHYALGGKPASTRLQEQYWFSLPSVLDRLESFARHPLDATPVEVNSCIRVLGRKYF